MPIFASLFMLLAASAAAAPSTGLTRRQADSRAAELWANHCAEVAADTIAPLPRTVRLDSVRTALWHLPDSLEPAADMLYAFGTNGSAPADGYPLYLYIHGSGPRDMEFATGLQLTRNWAEALPEVSAWFVPRIPNEGKYYRWWHQSKQWAWERLLRRIMADNTFNPDRIYLLGISEGGYGSQRLASFYADYFAAVGPMAGGEPLVNNPADNLRNTPFSLLTGSNDIMFGRNLLTAYVGETLDSLAALWPGDYIHRVELQQGRGHGIDYSPTAPWLSRFTRRTSPRRITWEDYAMDGRRRSAFANIEPLTRPESDDARVRYDLTIDSLTNSITLNVDSVAYTTLEAEPMFGVPVRISRDFTPVTSGKVRIYLDDTMLDLDRPVNVTLNGRKLPAVSAPRTADDLSRSLALWADPRRLYPASVTLAW